jgi:DNA-binding NtrC family response regulator
MKILIVDSDAGARRVVIRMLHAVPDAEFLEAGTVSEALSRADAARPDLLLVDTHVSGLPEGGLEVVRRARAAGCAAPAVLLSSSRSFAIVREALRLGVHEYVLKDTLSPELLTELVEAQRERFALVPQALREASLAPQALREASLAPPPLREASQALREAPLASLEVRPRSGATSTSNAVAILGSSPRMAAVRKLIARVADAQSPVLIQGETGTGKELVARALHDDSTRSDEPFVAVNCAALPGSLVESLLFGHERGAFTGAEQRRRGQIELARGGTLLLDEIAELPLDLQAKLLRVLEQRSFRPLGAESELPVRARVLAATHADLKNLVAQGRFRQDLFYRLDVVTIALPRLSERGADFDELLATFARASGRDLGFTKASIEWLRARDWPGNVRQLKNVVERIALLADDDLVDVADLEQLLGNDGGGAHAAMAEIERFAEWFLSQPGTEGSRLELVEHAILKQAIDRCGGNKTAAARLVGIDRKILERRWERTSAEGAPTSLGMRRIG